MIGENIRKCRKERKMSQTELAKLVHVSQQTITAWENNKAEPASSALVNLASVFHVSTDYLLGNDTPKADSHPYDLADDEPLTYHGVELPDDLRAYYKSMADAYIKRHKGDDGDA